MRCLFTIVLFVCAYRTCAQTNIITIIAGCDDTAAFGGDGGPATNAKLNGPEYLRLGINGNVYFSDCGNSRVRKINATTNIIETIAGNGSFAFNGDNISATSADLFIPEGICVDTAGNIYIADAGNSRIRKITSATGIITTVAGIGPSGVGVGGGG